MLYTRAPDLYQSPPKHRLLDIYQHTTGPRKKARERGEHREHPYISGGQRRHHWRLGNESIDDAPNPGRQPLCFPSPPPCFSERASVMRVQKKMGSGTHPGNIEIRPHNFKYYLVSI